MRQLQLGESELFVQPIVFGAWAIGGWYWGGNDPQSDAEAIRAIHASIDAGVCCFDTAPMYGYGTSETILGQAIADRREKVTIMTKVGLRWNCSTGAHFFDTKPNEGNRSIYRNLRPNSIRLEVEESLKRLGVEVIDLLQCHWPDPTTPIADTMEVLAELVQAGKVRAIGVSNFSAAQLEQSKNALAPLPLASTQPKYSLLDRQIETEVIPWLLNNNVGAIVYSPLEQGLLTGKVGPNRVFPSTDGRSRNPLFRRENRIQALAAIRYLKPIWKRHNISPAQMAIAWTTQQPGITSAIVGARTAQQAIENAAAADITLSQKELQLIGQAYARLSVARI